MTKILYTIATNMLLWKKVLEKNVARLSLVDKIVAKKNRHLANVGAIVAGFFFLLNHPSLSASPDVSLTKAKEQIEGLWRYDSLKIESGKEWSLTGLFLFQNGYFIQQSIDDGEPFEQQMAMANAGSYEAVEDGFKLLTEIGISVTPSKDPPLSLRRDNEYRVFPEYSEGMLTLTFGSGTVQTFRRIEAEKGDVFVLDQGYLGFAGNYFILFAALENGGVAGSGTFDQEGTTLRLHAMRWFSAIDGRSTYLRDQEIEATFDGEKLLIPDSPEFVVMRRY